MTKHTKMQKGSSILKIGMLTSGGDCQSLNPAMRGVALSLMSGDEKVEIYGFIDGYRGLIYENYKKLNARDFENIQNQGGTILGSSREPFKRIHIPDENGTDKVKAMIDTYNKLSLDCLVILGGNGTHKTANLLSENGLNIVTLPKTIDNDIWGTDLTFGFFSALSVATNTIDQIRTTACSHHRVFVVELMGHKAGWLALYAGIAGGADAILIPEIPYDIEKIAQMVNKKCKDDNSYAILAVAEGAISKQDSELSKKTYKTKLKNSPYISPGYEVADQLMQITGKEVRVAVPGHIQRGGSPSVYDRLVSTRLGAEAARLIKAENYGNMIGFVNGEITAIPLCEVAGKLKTVPQDCNAVLEAKELGICFGD